MHVIILDDEPAIGGFVCRVARNAGWTAESVLASEDFHRAFEAHRPDLIILDLQIGATDGVEQLRFLADAGYTESIVLLSGVDLRVLDSARQLGQDLDLRIVGALAKPMTIATLREVLTAATHAPGQAPSRPAGDLRPVWTAADIAAALHAGEMQLHLQPVIRASSGEVGAFEGLIRWRHPKFGMIAPLDFIPQAEADAEVIDALTLWVARTAIGHFKKLATLGLEQPIAINVSSANLVRLDFPDRLIALVEEMGVPPSALGLEMTETLAMADPRATIDVLTRLRLKGFTVALDDFGTAYSSLVALVRMPFNYLKIDTLFVAGLESSRECCIIAGAVIRLAKDLGMTSCAEGVETVGAADILRDLGADYLQGFLYSRALPLEDLIPWLRARTGPTGALRHG
jgi:EAL domain-containing protein (putative c-di-GMP-specific phosphodiesterase class I)/ActR/RegA family two-component response regulator